MITSLGSFLAFETEFGRSSLSASAETELVVADSACFRFQPGGIKAGRLTTGDRVEATPKLARGFLRPEFAGSEGFRDIEDSVKS
jgi:hypothetical protein